MEQNEQKRVWFVPVTKEEMIVRLFICPLSYILILIYLWLMGLGHIFNNVVNILGGCFGIFYVMFNIVEYLQTGKVVQRRMDPDVPMSGNGARFYVMLSIIAILFIIVLPFILK